MNFTNAVVQALVSAANNETFDADKTAAVETAAGFWGRAFSMATVHNGDVHPQVLSQIGRELCRHGESVWYIDVVNGTPVMYPVFNHQVVVGKFQRDSWMYDVQLPGPDALDNAKRVQYAQICHFQYSYDKARPWVGVSPLTWAIDTAMTMGMSEQRMKEEAGSPTGYLIPIPEQPATDVDEDTDNDPLAELKARLGALKGSIALVESMAAGWSDGRSGAPRGDWQPHRLGAHPPESLIRMRADMQQIILAACGVPPALASTTATQTSSRESWRQFLHGTIQPVATLVEAELRIKLNSPELSLTFERLFASDLQGRARAFKSMVDGGLSVQDAAIQSGLLEPEE